MEGSPKSSSSIIAPTLPFGDINLIVLTDVHSWVGGHGDNEGPDNLDVSYGDVVSFFEKLKEHCSSSSASNSIHDSKNGSGDNNNNNNNNKNDNAGCESGDLWLVQNGDWIDGTGLATDGDPTALIPLLERIPFDVLNTGNHELYRNSVIEEMRKPGGFLQWWGPRHLASNVYMNENENSIKNMNSNANANANGSTGGSQDTAPISLEPMSNRYHVLKGKRSTILVFGFIYNLPNPSDLVVVQTVEEAVKESWFQDALKDASIGYDAILVMLHAGHDDPSVEILRQEIRKITQQSGIDEEGNLPIQFIAGHTHYRRYAVADSQSTVVESGRYMDTVGWVSFPNSETIRNEKQKKHRKRRLQTATGFGNFTDYNESMTPGNTTMPTSSETESDSVTDLFHHVFLDANRATLREALGIPSSPTSSGYNGDDDDFQTSLGKEVSAFIEETRESLGLTSKIGCAPRDYPLNRSMVHEDSLWRLYQDEVGPHVLATVTLVRSEADGTSIASSSVPANNRALFMSQDSWRYGVFGGNHLTYDDIVVVSPFNEPIYRVSILPCSTILQLNQSMNADLTDVFYSPLPAWILSGKNNEMGSSDGFDSDADCELYVNHFGLSRVQNGLQDMAIRAEENNVAWDPIESNLTTTSIWFAFVEDMWQCQGSNGGDWMDKALGTKWGSNKPSNPGGTISESSSGDGNVNVVVIVVFLVVLCTVIARACGVGKKRSTDETNGYGGIMLDSSLNSDDASNAPGILPNGVYSDEDDGSSIDGFSKSEDGTKNGGEPSVQIV